MKLKYKDIMNFVLEHPQFPELIRIIKILSFHSIGKGEILIDEHFRELKLFYAAGIIREMAKDAYENPEFEKSPFVTQKIRGNQDDSSFTIDTCEIGKEKRETDFIGQAIESDFKLSEIQNNSEDSDWESKISVEEKAKRAKIDAVLRFRRLMERTNLDTDGH